jgi:hypothetical protein
MFDFHELIGTPNTDFNKIIKTTTTNFENKVKDRLTGKLDKELSKAGLPSFADLNNIQKNAYERVLNNADFGMGIGGYLENNWDVINNSLYLGLANKASANEDVKNNPKNAEPVKGKNVPSASLQYPQPSKEEQVPYMEISGFKYVYDADDKNGNRSSSHKGDKMETERTATIRLPLPGNLASGLSLQYEDYSSFFSKLVRAHKPSEEGAGASIDNMLANIKQATGAIDSQVWTDAGLAGGAAGLFSAAMGEGIGAAAAATIDEAFKYIRVQGGIAVNPMSQASYVGANIRTHSFEFHMVPRNQTEAIECKKIIEMLQYCSIGERSTALQGLLVNFPSVWNVSFHTAKGDKINGMLEIPDSFITEVNVTYSPTRAGFTVTRDNDPFAYVITLTFKEAQNLIRDDLSYIRQGGELLKHAKNNQNIPEQKLDIKPWDPESVAKTPIEASPVVDPNANNDPGAPPTPPKTPTQIANDAGKKVNQVATAEVVRQAIVIADNAKKVNKGLGAEVIRQAGTVVGKVQSGIKVVKDLNNALGGGKN